MNSPLDQPRLRVLLADVEHDFFVQITLLLEEIVPHRFMLEWASTYGFGVTVMRRQQFDLCLISSYIGHRRGTDLAFHIKANYPAIPVVMLVSSEEMADLPVDCLDRNRLSVEMLRPVVRDALFRSAGGVPRIPNLAQPVATEFVRVAAA